MSRDLRSDEANVFRRLYDLTAWKQLRQWQLRRNPLCELCTQQGLVTAATVVNHREPHKGDITKFFDHRNLQSVCKLHHDSAIQSHERTGVERGCDANGLPNDPASAWRHNAG
jgi:5-methylcytosine-specific restriction protein A